jgi:hypothetical protein
VENPRVQLKRVIVLVVLGVGVATAVAGCGHPATVLRFRAVRASITVAIGARLTVEKSAGECADPTSSDIHVLAPVPPAPAYCRPGQVHFIAANPGHATIDGRLACRGTACTGVRSTVRVTVRR